MKFELKVWENDYIDDLLYSTNDKHLADNLLEQFPCPMDNVFALEFIKQRMLNSEQKQICRAIVVDGRAVGSVEAILGSGVFEKTAYLSIWIGRDYRRQGLGTAVVKQACSAVFEKYNVLRIEAKPYSRDTIGIKMLKSAGFVHEGTIRNAVFKNNNILDYEIFSVIKS